MSSISNGKEKWPLVSIIIVNFNGKQHLKRCLKSILKCDYPNFEIIFVDNASNDGSVEFVKDLCGYDARVKIIQNSKNLGAAEGRNNGIRMANGEYVIFLDNDVEVTLMSLNELVEVMKSDSTIGIAQSMLLKMNDSRYIQYAGLFIIDYCGWTWNFCRDEMYDRFSKCWKQPIIISSAVGAAMCVRRKIFGEIGFFDPKLFIYFEDTDFSWRVWLRGYKVILVPKSIVYHVGGGSIEKGITASMFREYNYYKNCIRMLIKNYNFTHIFMFLPIAFMCMFVKALVHLMKGDVASIIGLFRALAWNIKEFQGTLCKRFNVQQIRRVSDNYIIEKVMRRPSFMEILKRL